MQTIALGGYDLFVIIVYMVGLVVMGTHLARHAFGLPEAKNVVISQIIAATVEAGLIKPDEKVGASRKFARYLPSWA